MELILIALHPLPYYDYSFELKQINYAERSDYVDVKYTVSEFLLVCMFLRIILLVRSVFNYTMFTDIYSRRLW